MTDLALHIVLHNPANIDGQARNAITKMLVPYCEQLWARGIDAVALTAEPQEDARSVKQNAFYWGWVLKCVSRQAKVNGIGSDADGWHWFFKKTVLGYRITKIDQPGRTRRLTRREIWSTTDLSVKQFSTYLEKVMAHATTEYGVEFDGKTWENWNG